MINSTLLKKPWFLLEKLHQYPPVNLEPPLAAMATDLKPMGLGNVDRCFAEYENGWVKLFYLESEWDQAAKKSLAAILARPEIMDRAHQRSNQVAQAMAKLSAEIIASDLQKISDAGLAKLYTKLLALQRELHFLRSVAWIMESRKELFSTYLLACLTKIIKTNKMAADPALVFSVLITPTKPTIIDQEHRDLLTLAKKITRHEIKRSTSEPLIKKHTKKYAFLPYGCEGPAWTEIDILNQINETLMADLDIDKLIRQSTEKFAHIKMQQKKWLASLSLDKKHVHLLAVARDIVFQKAWSKEHQYMGWYALSCLLTEVAKRLYITLDQTRYFLPAQIPAVIKKGKYDVDELNKRRQYSLLYVDAKGSYYVTGKKAKKIKAAMHIVNEATIIDSSIKLVRGQTAVAGWAVGKVTIINSIKQMTKMKKGDILVSEMTIPEIVSAMKKAAAIVTDAGGIICHAAIVSRELGIPCVIGTKIATLVFKDGDRVEVDATNGVIKKL